MMYRNFQNNNGKCIKNETNFIFLFALILLFFVNNTANAQKKGGFILNNIVIDAGHGGKDPGAVGKKGKEKDITLAVASKLGMMITGQYKDMNVYFTRVDDRFIELHERAKIANKNKADLFISIHVNANENKDAEGAEAWVLGLHRSDENLDVAKKENSVLSFESNIEENYGFDPNSPAGNIIMTNQQSAFLNQSISFAKYVEKQFTKKANLKNRGVHQAGFMVLYKSVMPSCLIELGFISNKEEEKYMMSDQGQTELATMIFNALKEFKKDYESGSSSLEKKNDSIAIIEAKANPYLQISAPTQQTQESSNIKVENKIEEVKESIKTEANQEIKLGTIKKSDKKAKKQKIDLDNLPIFDPAIAAAQRKNIDSISLANTNALMNNTSTIAVNTAVPVIEMPKENEPVIVVPKVDVQKPVETPVTDPKVNPYTSSKVSEVVHKEFKEAKVIDGKFDYKGFELKKRADSIPHESKEIADNTIKTSTTNIVNTSISSATTNKNTTPTLKNIDKKSTPSPSEATERKIYDVDDKESAFISNKIFKSERISMEDFVVAYHKLVLGDRNFTRDQIKKTTSESIPSSIKDISSTTSQSVIDTTSKATIQTSNTNDEAINMDFFFTIQIAAGKGQMRNYDAGFRGLKGEVVELNENNMYKYVVGQYPDISKAIEKLKKIKSKGYKDAFIILYEKGVRKYISY